MDGSWFFRYHIPQPRGRSFSPQKAQTPTELIFPSIWEGNRHRIRKTGLLTWRPFGQPYGSQWPRAGLTRTQSRSSFQASRRSTTRKTHPTRRSRRHGQEIPTEAPAYSNRTEKGGHLALGRGEANHLRVYCPLGPARLDKPGAWYETAQLSRRARAPSVAQARGDWATCTIGRRRRARSTRRSGQGCVGL